MKTLEQLEVLAREAATERPWRMTVDGSIVDIIGADGSCIAEDTRSESNTELAVEAVNALPALLVIAKAARAMVHGDASGCPVHRGDTMSWCDACKREEDACEAVSDAINLFEASTKETR